MNEQKTIQWFEKLKTDDSGKESLKKGASLTKKKLKAIRKDLGFEKHVEESYRWINEIAIALGDENRPDVAYHALRGVLFALRNRMVPVEVFQLSAQLPLHIRGIFFEGYNLKDKPQKYHTSDFLEFIENELGPKNPHDPRKAFEAVLKTLYNHVSLGELRDIYATMPKDLQEMWDEAVKTIIPE
jgi:uncharacterized protein (DUF2267 family)